MSSAIFRPLFTTSIKRLIRSPYAWTFAMFIVGQIVFLACVHQKAIPGRWSSLDVDAAQTAFFICSVHLLLSLNTGLFLRETIPVASEILNHRDLPAADATYVVNAYNAFVLFLLLCVFASGAVCLIVALGWFGAIPLQRWNAIIEVTEFVSGTLFLFFWLADLCCLEIFERAIRAQPRMTGLDYTRVKKKAQTLKRDIVAVDLPGFIGLWLIIVCTHMLYPEFIRVSYWEGFVAGAVGLHIMFSQAALAFLSILDE